VYNRNRWTLDVDAYHVHSRNGYNSYYDPIAADIHFIATGPSNTEGIELESNIALGYGFTKQARTSPTAASG
jgi:hypothetical protein